MKKNKLERIFVNPFSEEFAPKWELWKEYKRDEWNFRYKSVLSEQTAINELVELSGGNEDIAFRIIKQSMSNRWRGLFSFKDKIIPVNGKQGTRNPDTRQTTRESVNDAYSKRFGGGGQSSPVSGATPV